MAKKTKLLTFTCDILCLSYSHTTFELSWLTDVAFYKFLFNNVVKHLTICAQKTCLLGPHSHGNDIVPLSYQSDFWNGKVDCVYTGPVHYRTSFWDLFTKIRYRIIPKHFVPKRAKENLSNKEY